MMFPSTSSGQLQVDTDESSVTGLQKGCAEKTVKAGLVSTPDHVERRVSRMSKVHAEVKVRIVGVWGYACGVRKVQRELDTR